MLHLLSAELLILIWLAVRVIVDGDYESRMPCEIACVSKASDQYLRPDREYSSRSYMGMYSNVSRHSLASSPSVSDVGLKSLSLLHLDVLCLTWGAAFSVSSTKIC